MSKTKFDPAAEAASRTSPGTATAVADQPTPPARRETTTTAPVARQQNAAVQTVLRGQVEVIIAAHNLLAELEEAHADLDIGRVHLSPSQLSLLQSAGFPAAENRHELIRALVIQREIRLARERLVEFPIEQCREELEAALEAERVSAVNSLDVPSIGNTGLAARIRELQAHAESLASERANAETRLRSAEQTLAWLMEHAPAPLKAVVDVALEQYHDSPEYRRHVGMESLIASREVLADKNHIGHPLRRGFDFEAKNGTLDGLISRYCPEAKTAYKAQEGIAISIRYNYDKTPIVQAIERLAGELPALRVEQLELVEVVRKRESEIKQPLERWAMSGELLVEDLL